MLTAAGVGGGALLFLHGASSTSSRPSPVGPRHRATCSRRCAPGEPQTILVLGTDDRYGDREASRPVRSDTMMAVHLDPDRGATSVMSFPRDLQVKIPGPRHATRSTPRTRSAARSSPCETVERAAASEISHVVGVDFHGFRRAR